MRVVLACDWFLKYAAAQSIGLTRAGVDVLLLCRTHSHEFGEDEGEREAALAGARSAGVAVVEIPRRQRDPLAIPSLVRIRRRIVGFRPDVIHVHEGVDPRVLSLVGRTPIVLTVHDPVFHPGQPPGRGPRRWGSEAAREAWRKRASVIVVHSERLCGELKLEAGQRCVAIAHGLALRAPALRPPGQLGVGFFGRLAPYKGLDTLAQAMPRVWSARPEVQLHVAGSGAAPLPLSDDRVHLDRRYIPERELPAFFGRSSLVVLPYTQASQTGAGSLAVGFGLPLIATRVGGLPDLTLDRSYVVPPEDAAALSNAILHHIDDGSDVRARVQAQVAAPRSWDAVGAATLEVYESLLDGR